MKKLMFLSAMALFGVGCSHTLAKTSASYHQSRADRAAARGNYGTAADQQRKADRDETRAATAPLP